MCLGGCFFLHSKDAKALFFQRGIQCHRKGQAEHFAGVDGINDAVVPEAGGGVIGIAFGFVLLEDRGFEGFFFIGERILALTGELILFDGQ